MKISLGLDLDHWHKLLLATFLSSNTAFKTVSLGPQSVCDQFSYWESELYTVLE